jgi:hypothetical protein
MRLRSSSHSAKVLDGGDTSVHLGISGFELSCEAGFQRPMEKGGLRCAYLIPKHGVSSYFRVAISPVQKTKVSSFENGPFVRMIVFHSSSVPKS